MAFTVLPRKLKNKAGETGILPRELAIDSSGKEGRRPGSRWQDHIWVALSAYRLLAFAIAAAVIFAFPSAFSSVIPSLSLVICIGIYSLLKVLQPLRWYQGSVLGLSILGIDIAICVFLTMSTGGFYTPFLLYTLAPVLTAAIFLDNKVTFTIAGLSIAYFIGNYLKNPLTPAQVSFSEISYFSVYLTAICLAAVLPYLTNINLRQQLQAQDILQERQRLSHEIHDGIAQTLCALRWQAQLLHRRLAGMAIDIDEARQLEELAEKAHQDIRESLELLHNCSSDADIFSQLQEYLEHLKRDANIDFKLDMPAGEPCIHSMVKLELLRICQEALTNVRKHSGAHNVSVKLKPMNHHLEMSITDDGCGFDALAHNCNGRWTKGYGLAIMKERADSIGGKLDVLSSPGHGTEIQVEVPLTPH